MRKSTSSQRLSVKKTYKLYIGGHFPRSESGRSFQLKLTDGSVVNMSLASRKDLRNAVETARKALPGWKAAAPILRGQILYRLAEMMEARRDELIARLKECGGKTVDQCKKELDTAIDRVIWCAGWADKWQAIMGTVNPVAGPYFNISYHEPMGVVGIIVPESALLLGLVSLVMSCVVSGNTCVTLSNKKYSPLTITWAEMCATSDLPGGVINVLTGDREELIEHFYTHMDINALSHPDQRADLSSEKLAEYLNPRQHNLKRFPLSRLPKRGFDVETGPDDIARYTEVKTVWHPSQLP